MATREQALAALVALDPAPIFLEAYRSERLPRNLDIDFGPPGEFFLAPDTETAYTGGRLIPILDDGNLAGPVSDSDASRLWSYSPRARRMIAEAS